VNPPAAAEPRRVALAGVMSSSPEVSAELADAALGCAALVRARKLAEWVGSGKELTSSGVLRPAAALEACRVLGIRLPGARLRSALDVDELMRDWTVAVDAGFIVADGRRVCVAPDQRASPEPQQVLNAWMNAAARAVGVAEEPCAGCITVLHELSTSERPLSAEELADALAATEPDVPAGQPCPDCGGVHDGAVVLGVGGLLGGAALDELDSRGHAQDTITALAAFGAVISPGAPAFPDNALLLTPLGSMLARAVFEGSAPAPDADAGTVVAVTSVVPPPVARTLARPWLEARPADAAARELLAFAESASAGQRLAALAFARELGPDATAAWREWAERPGFGVYARRWLADRGEPTADDPADEAWLTVEALSLMLDTMPLELPPFLLAELLQQETGIDAAEMLSLLRSSGHPAAASVAALVTGQPDLMPSLTGGIERDMAPARRGSGSGPAAGADGAVYQLKISLRRVSKPPVWRRVAVPADITLAALHEVIVHAMGWHGGHLHVFSTDWAEYGTPGPDLGHADDSAVRLAEVLFVPGEKLRYTYDFGDDWEHDIQLEDILREDHGRSHPSCLAGKGACPPDDCGGAWGYAELKEILADPDDEEHQEMLEWLGLDSAEDFDPKEFSIDRVNARLRHLTTGP
jgi:hypothetical protein